MKNKPFSKITGVGHFVPENVVKNDDLATKYGIDTSDEWIFQRSGIKERRFVDDKTTNTDLAFNATERALKMAGLSRDKIDAIVFATLSPDYEFPGTGCLLGTKLGLPGVPAFDVRNQCTGFIYSLTIADGLIRTGQYKNVLVVGSEIHSRGLDLTTRGRDVAVLFGDGAGACIVSQASSAEDCGIYSTHVHADGTYAKELWLEAPGNAHHPQRLTHAMIDEGMIYPKMNGKVVFVNAVRRMPEVMMEALNFNGLKVSDMDIFVPHQANIRINEAVGKALGLRDDQIFNTIEKYGNTTAATIPIGLSEAVAAGKIKKGTLVGMAAFGSGFTWGSALVRW